MRRIVAAAALGAVLGATGCAVTPPDRLETEERSPVDGPAPAAGAPAVIPRSDSDALAALLASLAAKGTATLEDCSRLAELTSEDLLSGDEERLQAYLRRDQALAELAPTLSTTAYVLAQDRIPWTGSGASGGSSSVSGDREQWALTVRQPLFRGLREVSRRDVALRDAEAAAARKDVLRLALRRTVARAYFGVLAAEQDVRILEETDRLDRSRIDEVRAREANGIARRTEVLLLEQDHQGTVADLQRARTQRDVARSVLAGILGTELSVPLVGDPVPAARVPDLGPAVREAVESRPELRRTARTTESAEAGVRVARSEYWPEVYLAGNWYLAQSGVGATTKATDWDVTLGVSFPFFTGLSTEAREREARSNVRTARLEESRALRAVVDDVRTTHARAASSGAILATYERSAQLARENLDLLSEEYRQGVATNLEVLVAQTALQRALLAQERQRLETRLSHVELLLAIGRTENRP